MNKIRGLILAWSLVSVCFLAACGGGDDGGGGEAERAITNQTAEASMTGNWRGSFSTGVDFVMALTQSGEDLTGSYDSSQGGQGTVFGTVSGNSVVMTVDSSGSDLTEQFTGTVNDHRTQMGGSYTIIDGGSGSGTWSASKSD